MVLEKQKKNQQNYKTALIIFWENYASGETLLDRQEGTDEKDTREISDLLVDQIEIADVIILNKMEMLKEIDKIELISFMKKLNGNAEIIETSCSNVDLNKVLNTGKFDFDKVSQSAGWIKELNEDHVPETEEYGITSFVFRRQKPFHPERLMTWMENWPAEVVRAIGFIWGASRNYFLLVLCQRVLQFRLV